jgi:hypothetical protein
MALKMVKAEGSGSEYDISLQLKEWEWVAIRRALRIALERADRVGASADVVELRILMESLEIHVTSRIIAP